MSFIGKVQIQVGSCEALVCPENVEAYTLALQAASKVPTVRQARAKALMGGVSRKYPKFKDGMSTAEYVRAFAMLNTTQTGHGIQRGQFLSVADIAREENRIKDFFEPLSTLPQFASSDEVSEEALA